MTLACDVPNATNIIVWMPRCAKPYKYKGLGAQMRQTVRNIIVWAPGTIPASQPARREGVLAPPLPPLNLLICLRQVSVENNNVI